MRSTVRCFGDVKDTIDSKQLKNQIYLLRFGHTRALLFLKKWPKWQFPPSSGNWPIYVNRYIGCLFIGLLEQSCKEYFWHLWIWSAAISFWFVFFQFSLPFHFACLLADGGGPVYRPRSTGLTAPKIATLLQHNTTQHYNTTQHNTTTEHNRTEHNTTQHNTTQQVRSGN